MLCVGIGKQQHAGLQSSWLRQLGVLFWRTMMHDVRNPADVMARVFIAVGIGGLIGLVFLHGTAGVACVHFLYLFAGI